MVVSSGGGNTVTRTLIPVLLTLLILGILFLLYFLKYIPGRQSALNNRAFKELQQIAKAAQERDDGYTYAIATFSGSPQSSSPLLRSFTWSPRIPDSSDAPLFTRPSKLVPDAVNKGSWLLTYPLASLKIKDSFVMSLSLDSLLAPNILTYRDVFETYLLINRSPSGNAQGSVLFSLENLPLANGFNPDSLLKKNDNSDPLYIHEANIGGTPYKIFVYPLQIGSTSMLLAGLVSVTHYNAGYKDIPLSLFVPAGIIILLLVICLPILKIFILGAGETIIDWNIRQLIGSYFVAAFTCFFLFSWLFLTLYQSADNERTLNSLSDEIHRQFTSEIDTMCLQLKNWDEAYKTIKDSSNLITVLGRNGIAKPMDSIRLDKVFRPDIYPYSDYVYWVDPTGKWTAAWSEKKNNGKPPLLDAHTRSYFSDFIKDKYLSLHKGSPDFTIQPLLSRQDGEYRINVVIRSTAVPTGAPHLLHRPLLIGLSAKMYSVMNTVLPNGYSFSIIDDNGNILYDSRPGRALLSNILRESEDAPALQESLRFRTPRYFSHFQLKGRDVALRANPISHMPYTLVTYADLSDADHFQIHVIGLTAFLTIGIVALLILSTVVNEWTKKKPHILLAPYQHFEWLRPLPRKDTYYRHLIVGMLILFAVYCFIWFIISLFFKTEEFALFFISLSFPLYIALHYFSLRQKESKQKKFAHLSRPLVIYFSILFGTLTLSVFYGTPSPGIPLLFLAAQGLLFFTWQRLAGFYMSSKGLFRWGRLRDDSWLRHYSIAVITGVFMISIVPAWSLFLLFFNQETSLRHNSSRLETAWLINHRRTRVNERMAAYKFNPADTGSSKSISRRQKLKFNQGIYLLWDDSISSRPTEDPTPFFPIANQYGNLHSLFFPGDSNVLAEIPVTGLPAETTWNFTAFRSDGHISARLNYKYPPDKIDQSALQLVAGREATFSSIAMSNYTYLSIGSFHYILFDLAEILFMFLFYKLTIALSTRIFLIDMFRNGLRFPCPTETDPSPPPCSDGNLGFEGILSDIRKKESAFDDSNPIQRAENILCIRATYTDTYERKWKALTPEKKFILFDLARDGFSNYRTANVLFELMRDRLILFSPDQHLELVTDSFREFVLQKSDDPEFLTILKDHRQKGEWLSFKTGLMILFTSFGLFIFFTQDALFQKMTGLLTALITITTQFSTLFGKAGPKRDI